ncbi:MAG TPA: hypothetical protein VKT32_09305, partial [Chthonomonadaceae bacterium]|nr:hypothetical protein [Chthonomonadaceae bacterium]
TRLLRVWTLALMLALGIGMMGATGVSATAWAQVTHKKVHKNFAQRHPTMTSIGAGYAAYKVAKVTGHNRELHGRKKNFAQRHPFLTGMGAAAVTHHYIKKSMKHQH